jgi:hypothetical protein
MAHCSLAGAYTYRAQLTAILNGESSLLRRSGTN